MTLKGLCSLNKPNSLIFNPMTITIIYSADIIILLTVYYILYSADKNDYHSKLILFILMSAHQWNIFPSPIHGRPSTTISYPSPTHGRSMDHRWYIVFPGYFYNQFPITHPWTIHGWVIVHNQFPLDSSMHRGSMAHPWIAHYTYGESKIF